MLVKFIPTVVCIGRSVLVTAGCMEEPTSVLTHSSVEGHQIISSFFGN